MALLTGETECYAARLTGANWHFFCNQLQKTLCAAKTWSLLRVVLDPKQAKTETQAAIRTLIHREHLDEARLLATLQQRYISVAPAPIWNLPLDFWREHRTRRGPQRGGSPSGPPGSHAKHTTRSRRHPMKVLRNIDDISILSSRLSIMMRGSMATSHKNGSTRI